MREYFIEQVEFLTLQQKVHVIRKDKCVARRYVDSLFKGNLSVVQIAKLLERQSKVAKCFFIVRLYLECVKKFQGCILVVIEFVVKGAEIH